MVQWKRIQGKYKDKDRAVLDVRYNMHHSQHLIGLDQASIAEVGKLVK